MVSLSKSATILLCVTLLIATVLAQSNNCLMRSPNGACTLCVDGKALVDGNCVSPISHCVRYSSANQCSACEKGYELSASRTCEGASNDVFYLELSFKVMSDDEVSADSDLAKVRSILKMNKVAESSESRVYRVFRSQNNGSTTYRIIYQEPKGFSETLAEINSQGSQIKVENHMGYLKAANETTADIAKDPLAP